MEQNQISSLGATRINIGLSAIIKISPQPYQSSVTWKILSGGGTLEVVQPPPALTGTSAVVQGTGYPVGASEVFNIAGPACFYLCATGATMVIGLIPGYSGNSVTLVIA